VNTETLDSPGRNRGPLQDPRPPEGGPRPTDRRTLALRGVQRRVARLSKVSRVRALHRCPRKDTDSPPSTDRKAGYLDLRVTSHPATQLPQS